jgi:hypothetical protein
LEQTAPGEVVAARKQEVREKIPRIYKNARNFGRVAWTYARAPVNALVNSRTFGGHDNQARPEKHALIQDTLAVLDSQPASIYVQVNTESLIHIPEDAIEYGRLVMDRLAHQDGRGITILIGSGGLDAHTHEPAARQAAENVAFPDILRILGFLRGKNFGVPKLGQEFSFAKEASA